MVRRSALLLDPLEQVTRLAVQYLTHGFQGGEANSLGPPLPTGKKATAEHSPIQLQVSFAKLADDAPPTEVVDVAERSGRNTMPEVVAPSTQHSVDRLQQDSQCNRRWMGQPKKSDPSSR